MTTTPSVTKGAAVCNHFTIFKLSMVLQDERLDAADPMIAPVAKILAKEPFATVSRLSTRNRHNAQDKRDSYNAFFTYFSLLSYDICSHTPTRARPSLALQSAGYLRNKSVLQLPFSNVLSLNNEDTTHNGDPVSPPPYPSLHVFRPLDRYQTYARIYHLRTR